METDPKDQVFFAHADEVLANQPDERWIIAQENEYNTLVDEAVEWGDYTLVQGDEFKRNFHYTIRGLPKEPQTLVQKIIESVE